MSTIKKTIKYILFISILCFLLIPFINNKVNATEINNNEVSVKNFQNVDSLGYLYNFDESPDYAGVFKSFSVTVRHIKGYLAISRTCVSIGGGWHSRRYAVSAAVSYYWLINSSYSTLGSIMDRVRFNSNKYV